MAPTQSRPRPDLALACGFGDQLGLQPACTLLNRAMLPREVVAVVGGSYNDRRRYALAIVSDVLARGMPVLIASPRFCAGEVHARLEAMRVATPARIQLMARSLASDLALAPAIGPLLCVDDSPNPTLSHLWGLGAEIATSATGRRCLGAVLVDGFDAFAPEDSLRLHLTAEFLGAPVLVVEGEGFGVTDVLSQADVAILVGPVDSDLPRGAQLAWVGRRSADVPTIVLSALRYLGIEGDLPTFKVTGDPDTPLYGWRLLTLAFDQDDLGPMLASPLRGQTWAFPVQEASCELGHRAPRAKCTCGIYASSSLSSVQNGHDFAIDRVVVALVRGFGFVAIHEYGWRAQFCQPLALFGNLSEATRKALQLRYECEIASLFPRP